MRPVLLLLLFLFITSCSKTIKEGCDNNQITDQFSFPVTLSDKLTIEEIEFKESHDGQKVPSFGRMNKQWLKFKSNYQDGDCIYAYFSNAKNNRDGYILIRKNQIVESLRLRFY